MMRVLVGFLIITLVFSGAARAATEEGLIVARHGDWTVEIVADGERAACSALIEREGGTAAFVQMTSDSPFVLPVFETLAVADPVVGGAQLWIVVGALEIEASVEITSDEEGVYVAAHPAIEDAQTVIAAMRDGGVVRLVVRERAISALPLNGFEAAYAAAEQACVG